MLRAGIIGAGRIAWAYDGGIWDGLRSVSHASCFDRHPDTQLVAIMEPNAEARHRFESDYKGADPVIVCRTLEAFFAQNLDVVIVASPTKYHKEHVLACLEAKIGRIGVEKPVSLDAASFKSVVERLSETEHPPRIVVNYFRRFLPQVEKTKLIISQALKKGTLQRVEATYSRDIAVNGVHLLDLMGYFFDVVDSPKLDWADCTNIKEPSFGLTLKGIPVGFSGIPELDYHALELRAVTQEGRVTLARGGLDILWEAKEPNQEYPGFFHLAEARPLLPLDVSRRAILDGTYLSLCNLLDDTCPSKASLESSYFAQSLIDKVLGGHDG